MRSQALEDARLPLTTPGDQVRRVKALPALQGTNGAGLGGGGIGLRQDAQLVFGSEGPTLGVGDNFWVWLRQRRRRRRDGFACRRTPAASLRSSDLRSAAGKTVGRAGEIPLFFKLIPILALLSN